MQPSKFTTYFAALVVGSLMLAPTAFAASKKSHDAPATVAARHTPLQDVFTAITDPSDASDTNTNASTSASDTPTTTDVATDPAATSSDSDTTASSSDASTTPAPTTTITDPAPVVITPTPVVSTPTPAKKKTVQTPVATSTATSTATTTVAAATAPVIPQSGTGGGIYNVSHLSAEQSQLLLALALAMGVAGFIFVESEAMSAVMARIVRRPQQQRFEV